MSQKLGRNESAYLATLPAMKALHSSTLVVINRDPMRIARAAFSVSTGLERHAPEIARLFPDEPPPWKTLETQSLALMFANDICQMSPRKPIDFASTLSEACGWRDRLRAAALVLTSWRLVEALHVPARRGRSRDPRRVASEIDQYTATLRPHLSLLTREMPRMNAKALAAAEHSATQLLRAKAQVVDNIDRRLRLSRQMRQRAYTLVFANYERFRHALMVFRPESEANVIMPSLRKLPPMRRDQPTAPTTPFA